MPLDGAAGAPLFRHILFPSDGSDISERAARSAVTLARSLGARLTALHVIPPYLPPVPHLMGAYTYAMTEEEYERAVKAEAEQILGTVSELAREANVPCDTVSIVSSAPWDAIIRTAGERACDAIVMASHGRKGLSGLILGSETTKVLTHCAIPVLVTR
jgi:nucleotide-binding universal stress UspA family protein